MKFHIKYNANASEMYKNGLILGYVSEKRTHTWDSNRRTSDSKSDVDPMS